MSSRDADDLTARLVSLREVLERMITAGAASAAMRMDAQDKARAQYLDQLAERTNLLREDLDRRLGGLQLQLDQRLDALRELTCLRCDQQGAALEAASASQQTAMRAALASAEQAVSKAEIATEKRFDGVNEFRAQLSDQAATFMSRREYQAAHAAVVEKVDALTSRINLGEGSASGQRDTRDSYRLNVNVVIQALSFLLAAGIVFAAIRK